MAPPHNHPLPSRYSIVRLSRHFGDVTMQRQWRLYLAPLCTHTPELISIIFVWHRGYTGNSLFSAQYPVPGTRYPVVLETSRPGPHRGVGEGFHRNEEYFARFWHNAGMCVCVCILYQCVGVSSAISRPSTYLLFVSKEFTAPLWGRDICE